MSPRAQFFAGACVIVVATLAVYWPALHAGFIWDDDDYVTKNVNLRDLAGLWRVWSKVGVVPQYYPLVHTTFWIEYHLWGLHPLGYHLVNVLLHALAAILLGRVLARLQTPGAWLIAAIFAIHPVQVESVAWITERKNVLSATFYFAAALAYLRFAASGDADASGKRRWDLYVGALILFVAALLSKTVTCSLPAALLLVCWWKNGRLRGRDILPVVPLFAIGAGLGLLTAWIEKHMLRAQGAEWSLTFVERGLVAGRALWFYVGKLIWPAELTFNYPRWQIHAGDAWQWGFPLAAAGVVGALWLARRRIGRGPLVAALFFAGTLGPALGFVNVYPMRYSYVADHFQYLASAGMIALFVGALASAWVKWELRRAWGFAVASIVLVGLGALTWLQTQVYQDLETLWSDTVAKNPASWMAHNNLGRVYLEKNDTERAEIHLRQALAIKPDIITARNNLGLMYYDRGQMEQAINEFHRALEIDPDYSRTYNNLALVFQKQGEDEKAIQFYEKAIVLARTAPEPHVNLARIYRKRKLYDQAIPLLEKVIAFAPYVLSA